MDYVARKVEFNKCRGTPPLALRLRKGLCSWGNAIRCMILRKLDFLWLKSKEIEQVPDTPLFKFKKFNVNILILISPIFRLVQNIYLF